MGFPGLPGGLIIYQGNPSICPKSTPMCLHLCVLCSSPFFLSKHERKHRASRVIFRRGAGAALRRPRRPGDVAELLPGRPADGPRAQTRTSHVHALAGWLQPVQPDPEVLAVAFWGGWVTINHLCVLFIIAIIMMMMMMMKKKMMIIVLSTMIIITLLAYHSADIRVI